MRNFVCGVRVVFHENEMKTLRITFLPSTCGCRLSFCSWFDCICSSNLSEGGGEHGRHPCELGLVLSEAPPRREAFDLGEGGQVASQEVRRTAEHLPRRAHRTRRKRRKRRAWQVLCGVKSTVDKVAHVNARIMGPSLYECAFLSSRRRGFDSLLLPGLRSCHSKAPCKP